MMHIQVLFLALLSVCACNADPQASIYGGSLGNSGGGGGLLLGGLTTSYGQLGPNAGGSGYGELIGNTVPAAIATKRTYEVRPIMVQNEIPVPSVVDVQASEQPVKVIFRTQSSPVMVQQVHTPSAPTHLERTNSEDEPHRVMHEVLRPVIQEVREIIQPFRRVTQEVRPVVEEIHTVVAKGGNRAHQPPPGPYQDHGKPVMLNEEIAYAAAAAANVPIGNELTDAVYQPAYQPPPPSPSGHPVALASMGNEMYALDPSIQAAMYQIANARSARVKSRRSTTRSKGYRRV